MKKKEARAAEPEMVYGRGRAVQGCLMQFIVPKKDVPFLRDLAKVRGWRLVEDDDIQEVKTSTAKKVGRKKG